MSSDCFGIEQTSDGVVITGYRQPWGRFRGAPWTLNVKLTGDRYSRESVGELISQVLEEIQNPGAEFTIEDPGTPQSEEVASAAYSEVATPDGERSASVACEATVPVDALRFARVADGAPHCFSQAELRFHNLVVIRRAGDETDLVVHVAEAEAVRFVLKPEVRNALVAALMAPA